MERKNSSSSQQPQAMALPSLPQNQGGFSRPKQQHNYPAPALQQHHRHQRQQQQQPQYPKPQNWQQMQPLNPGVPGVPGQIQVPPQSNPQFSYPLPQGTPLHLQPYVPLSREPSQTSPAESEFAQSSASPSEASDPHFSPYAMQYPPPQGYYPQPGNSFVPPQPGFPLYGQMPGHPQAWTQPQVPPQQKQLQPGFQMPYLTPFQQQQQHLRHQAWEAGGLSQPLHFQGYGYHQPYGSAYTSPTSSRTSSGRVDRLRSSGTSGSGSGGRASPRNNHPRQDSVAASSENSFSPYGNVAGQSPRASETSPIPRSSTSKVDSASATGAQAEAEATPPRSEYVLWCGNVPSDATLDELWSFFSRLPAEEGGPPSQPVAMSEREATQDRHGILSIFIISRSNCAFINYISDAHLQRALSYFHGKIIRPHDSRCQRLVVRIRKKGDEQMSGVSGQRGKGIHVAWVKEQERRKKEAIAAASNLGNPVARESSESKKTEEEASITERRELGADSSPEQSKSRPPSGSGSGSNPSISGGVTRPSPTHESSAGSIDSSNSFTSTNSSLFRHPAFRTRYFILKSASVEQLDKAVETGQWRTQPHNEAVLDQAFRNSEDVILVFSANQSGNFYGYAKMKGPISPHNDENLAPSSKTAFISTPTTATIAENEDEDTLDDKLSSSLKPAAGQTSGSRIVLSPQDGVDHSTLSPLPLTPSQQGADTNTYFPPQTEQVRPRSSIVGASWPPVSNSPESGEERRASISPSLMASAPSIPVADLKHGSTAVSSPSRAETATPKSPPDIPMVMVKGPSGSGSSSNTATESHSAPTTLEPAPIDQFGVTRRDMINGGNKTSINSPADHNNSLGPQDSVSWPDSRAFSELAIRAVIHNLRLEEKESLKEAREASEQSQQLESSLKSEGQSETKLDPNHPVIKSSPASANVEQIGRPFPIEWKETRPLPFAAVRNLRNPWRDNRQIKVSRDGTELEPTVGKALLEEWEKAVKGQ